MTSNILHHMRELQNAWRKQDFVFSKQQKEEYNLLLTARRERIQQYYAEGRVYKGKKAEE